MYQYLLFIFYFLEFYSEISQENDKIYCLFIG